MKNLSFVSLFLALFIVSSCSNVNNEMLKMIPADAAMVASVNPTKVADHFGVKCEGEKIVLPEELKSQLDSKDMNKIDSLLNVIKEVGVDFDANMYYFVTSNEKPAAAFLVPIKDAKKAKESLTKQDSKISFKEENGIAFSDKIAIKDHVLMCFGGCDKSEVAKFFAGDFENITSVSDADKTLKEGDDMNVYMNYERIFSLASKIDSQNAGNVAMLASFMKGLRGMAYNVKLDDNEVNVDVELFAEKDCDFIKLLEELKGDPSTEFLEYMPADANVIFSVAIDGEKLAKYEGVKGMLEMMGQKMNGLNLVDLVSSIKEIGIGAKIDIATKKVFGSFCVMTNKGAVLEGIVKSMMGSSPSIACKATEKAFVVTYSSDGVALPLVNSQEVTKKLFGKYYSAGYLNLPVSNMNMYLESYSKDVKEGKGLFYIKSGDKKMTFFEYPKYFIALQNMSGMNASPYPMGGSDYSIEENDTLAVDSMAVAY